MPKKPTTKRATRKATKKKGEDLQFADGKVEDIHKVSTGIEELLSVKPKNPFGTAVFAEFEDKLAEMNLSQMQELAVRASVFPSGNKANLKNKLKREFKTRFGSTNKGVTRFSSSTEAPLLDPASETAKEVLRILNS